MKPRAILFFFSSFITTASCLVIAPAVTTHPSSVVHLTSGSFRGISAGAPNNTDRWLGIPFAQPPIGSLRFKAPVPIRFPPLGVKDATQFGNACPQLPSDHLGAPLGEDCLFLNVWRPTGTTAKDRLPVLAWIYPGSFMNEAASDPGFDPTRIITRSVTVGKPIIFVSMNYRLNTFGFLASSHVAPEDLNAGFHDQRLALTFIQENIAAFGGDPEKVTVWGQSAGAGSIEAHVLFPVEQPLFRAGILDSSTGPMKTAPRALTYDEPGQPYSNLVRLSGCPEGPLSFECLHWQRVPFEILLNVTNTLTNERVNGQLWQPAVGPPGSFVPVQPSEKIKSGNFLHVPLIAGTNLNEGTLFSKVVLGLSTPASDEDTAFDTFIRDLLIDPSTVTTDTLDTINKLYPVNDPNLGGVFHTGDILFDRSEAWYTDNMYLAARRLFFEAAAPHQPLFGYFFNEFIPGNNITLGVFHSSKLELLFRPVPIPIEDDFANQLTDFYINFITDLNPGVSWPRFTLETKQLLQLMRNNITAIPDDFLLDKTTFLNSKDVLKQMQK